jgi:rubrerythrin
MKLKITETPCPDSVWSTSDVEWICEKCQIVITQDELDKCPLCKKRKYLKKKS